MSTSRAFDDQEPVWIARTPTAIGASLADYRRRAGLTQAELADMCGIHRSYLSDLERGSVASQVERLFRVVRQLGLEVRIRKAGAS